MKLPEPTPWRVVDIDVALDAIQTDREAAIAQLTGEEQARRLALLADAEAACWEQVFDRARTRAHWRAALAAREWAQQLARTYQIRAVEAASCMDTPHPAVAVAVAVATR